MDSAFAWLRETDLEALPVGTHQIADGVRAIVQQYTTVQPDDRQYEAHRKFIDIQCLVRGRESMLVIPTDELTATEPYDDENDVIFYPPAPSGSMVVVRTGEFAVFFPQDAHMPMLVAQTPEEVLKVVIKVAR